ncbi:MAG: hypothetical protein AAF533_18070 [Acidobacteriota bacterium]
MIDSDGKPLAGATVTGTTPDPRQFKQPDSWESWPPVVLDQVVTGSDGRYEVEGKELIYFFVRFEKEGYFSQEPSYKATDFWGKPAARVSNQRMRLVKATRLAPARGGQEGRRVASDSRAGQASLLLGRH